MRTIVGEFKSSSSTNTYQVVSDSDGTLSCSCPGWRFSGRDRSCKHVRKVLGVTVTPPKTTKISKSKAKAKSSTKKAKVEVPPEGLKLKGLEIPYHSPMLAQAGTDELLEERFSSDDWVAEEKFDGARYLMFITKDGNRFFSRQISVKDDLPVEKTNNIPHLSGLDLKSFDGTVLDGEIFPPTHNWGDTTKVMGSLPEEAIRKQKESIGWMEYHVFDILYFKGKNVMNESLQQRRASLSEIPFDKELKLTVQIKNNKREFYDKIVAKGGEGVILKNINSTYRPGERDKDVWMKVKKSQTFDVVTVGFQEPKQYSVNVEGETVENSHWLKGWIAAITFGVYKDGVLTQVGNASGINDQMREEISKNKDKYIGKVIEITGQELLKTGGVRFPKFLRFRDDIDPKTCTLKKLQNS